MLLNILNCILNANVIKNRKEEYLELRLKALSVKKTRQCRKNRHCRVIHKGCYIKILHSFRNVNT